MALFIRNWLIKRLAGRDMIIVNARIEHGTMCPQPYFEGAGKLMYRVEFDGRPDRPGGFSFRKQGRAS